MRRKSRETRPEEEKSAFQAYSYELKALPQLSRDEMHALYMRIEEGDDEARKLLAEASCRLALYFVNKAVTRDKPYYTDAVAYANVGLARAARDFDPTRGGEFSTYAANWIKKGIQVAKKAFYDLDAENRCPVSLNTLVNDVDGGKTELGEFIVDRRACTDAIAQHKEIRLIVDKLLSDNLWSQEETVIRMSFGLRDNIEYTDEEIAKELKLDSRRVETIRTGAMKRLKKACFRSDFPLHFVDGELRYKKED